MISRNVFSSSFRERCTVRMMVVAPTSRASSVSTMSVVICGRMRPRRQSREAAKAFAALVWMPRRYMTVHARMTDKAVVAVDSPSNPIQGRGSFPEHPTPASCDTAAGRGSPRTQSGLQFHRRDETGRYGESLFPPIRGVHVLGQNIQLSAIGEFERARRIEHVKYRPPRQTQSP